MTIHGSRADADCGTFIEIRGGATKRIRLRDNDTEAAHKPIAYENDAIRKAVIIK